MYRVMVYDASIGWVEACKVKSYEQAVEELQRLKSSNPSEQFDITYTPSKRKGK
jgi:hypothetical protein